MERDRHWLTGDVLVRDGRIAEIRPGGAGGVTARQVLDASGAVVLPGFIQCHVHVVQSLLRHQADGMELLDWLERRTLPYEAALDGDGVTTAAELGIAELLTGGTTTVLDFGTTHDHDRVFESAERMGIRMTSGRTHMDMGSETAPALIEDADASLADAEASAVVGTVKPVADSGMRWLHASPCRAPGGCSKAAPAWRVNMAGCSTPTLPKTPTRLPLFAPPPG